MCNFIADSPANTFVTIYVPAFLGKSVDAYQLD